MSHIMAKYKVRNDHFPILDALRAVLAFVVVFGHLGMPPLFGAVNQPDPVLQNLARFWRTMSFGPPAVIAFFVISGFCIHYSFVDPARNLNLLRFYARRYLRIVVPVLAVFIILWHFNTSVALFGKNSILWNSTLWSILCEEIYYAVYPIILVAGRRFGMRVIFLVSLLPSIVIVGLGYPAVEWTEIGIIGTSIMLFPVWLLGVLLAEMTRSGSLPLVSTRAIVLWRLGAWCVMWLALIAHFHTTFHQTISFLPVGTYAFFWLRAELGRAALSNAPQLLVSMGAGSYSLYLVHPLILNVFKRESIFATVTPLVGWCLAMAFILAGSWIFYLLIEAPSHRMARRISLHGKQRAVVDLGRTA